MTRLMTTIFAALMLTLAGAFVPVASQDAKNRAEGDDPHAAWAKLQQPGPEHKALAEDVGDWTIKARYWPAAGAPAIDMAGTSKMSMIFDRYLYEEYKLGEGEQAFEGRGYIGYDNSNKEFQAVYFGNDGTWLHVLSGHADGKTNTLTLSGEWVEKGMGGAKVKQRVVSTRKSKDASTTSLFMQIGDKPEWKMVEMEYTRGK